ncbi:peptidoglycan-binding domain-containing protein [Halorussus ruber]|uniref:peptidoglycan-binding domain-containing protein n=1 Tax=Halorussus ruber TaxID=1126238 RepID=UPI00109268CF
MAASCWSWRSWRCWSSCCKYVEGYFLGYYGPETESTIEDFQTNAGITVDSVVSHDTWQALMDIPN